jgi:peptide-methionine (S)-S-oxide reductase
MTTPQRLETADFGGGCFWCLEAVFRRLPGVESVVSGYAGGRTENPGYQAVCNGTTGHAEVARIEFDPAKISYARLLEVFWLAHDPTTLNRQGNDAGTQYRSIILYHTPEQQATAEESKRTAQAQFQNPMVTQIVPLTKFYPAEDHHQEYYEDNASAPYCQVVIAPKLRKLERQQVIKAVPQTPS